MQRLREKFSLEIDHFAETTISLNFLQGGLKQNECLNYDYEQVNMTIIRIKLY